MIKVKICEAAKRRGFKNAYQFGKSIGFSDRVALRIWDNQQPPKLKTLDRICNAWGCPLNELIEHRLDKPSANGHTKTLPQRRSLVIKRVPGTKAAKLARSKRSQ